MGKEEKSKSKKGSSSARPAPYDKRPKVEVKFEGAAPSASTSAVKTKKARPVNVKKESSAPSKASPSADKGKAKAVPLPSKVESESEDEEEEEAEAEILPRTFIIIAGSYEKLLYGIEGTFSSDSISPKLEPIFIFPAHLACVKAVAASKGGKWLATGSEDEFVKVWDLRRRKEVGSLSQHTGSITSLHFPTSSHLITTSEDSTLSLFRTSDWALLKSLKGHSGRVNHVDVHPTGRVALSVGKDNTLKMWDLMRGRGAASLPLGSEPEMVKFSQAGTHFAVLFPRKIQIYSLTLKLLHTLETKSRFNTLLFATILPVNGPMSEEELLCVGTEKGIVEVYNIKVGTEEPHSDSEDEDEDEEAEASETKGNSAKVERVGTLVGHTNRIKSLSALPFEVPAEDEEIRPTILLTTVSSDGLINVHDLFWVENSPQFQGVGEDNTIEPIASYNTKGSRLTCVTLADGQDLSKKLAKQRSNGGAPAKTTQVEDAEEEDSEDDEDDDEEEDIYESGEDDGEEDEEMAVEFEDEEEEEEEEEYED
ncbi:hypothetical protein I203_105757 [Kwoniella mangroviensis CBS 8507]|uniref:uncharacterized protein n=1 Tax=Kwoniella mangroviensis CBS 8507 TaxID=1296122 RepID=UPI00080D1E2F|nr:protein MAK11 [Kwoniella mangroviensis CBS 8507]OCF69705.1 protein MAK11 [Kwoniella mangroviensis CBS 8507]